MLETFSTFSKKLIFILINACFPLLQILVSAQTDLLPLKELGRKTNYTTYLKEINNLYDELFTKRNYHQDLALMNTKLLEMDPATYRLEIALAIQMVYIIDIDVATQTLQALIELQLKWQDQRLAWDPEKYDDLESLYVSCESLWAPEEFLVSAPTVTEVIPDRFKQCIIYSNGTVGYDLMLRIENSCAMNVRKFPFDTQSCAIFFTSNQYDWYQVLLLPTAFTKYHDSTFDRMGNGEWSFVNTSFEVTYDEKENFQIASFVLTCKREPAFYIYVITLPCFLLTFLSITGCFWTKNVREEQLTKLSIALTSMMSMTTFVDMVSQQMPKTSEFPLLGIFVLTCVFITSISCVVLVVFPEKRNPRENKPLELTRKERLKYFILSLHFAYFSFFQGANLISFIVFLSFWK